MKGLALVKPKVLEEKEITETAIDESFVKVKITKALITLNDLNRFNGETEVNENTVLGSYGVGVIIEAPTNLFDLKKGDKVFIESKKPCEDCYNCNNNNKDKCLSPLTAGEDYDGFLRDFISISASSVYHLPDSVSEKEALFINYISVAENIIDSLEISKGQYVAIVGFDNFTTILSQLLVYYQAIPIVICEDEEQKKKAVSCGAYYVFSINDNISKEVNQITGGRMADSVVYNCDSSLPVVKAFMIASYGSNVAFTGFTNKITSFSFNQAIKKQLKIHCINNIEKNTPISINLLVNKAIDINKIDNVCIKYQDVKSSLTKASKEYEKSSEFSDFIVDMI